MSFPTVYYITQVIPPCYSAVYEMCVCVSRFEPVYIGSLDYMHIKACIYVGIILYLLFSIPCFVAYCYK